MATYEIMGTTIKTTFDSRFFLHVDVSGAVADFSGNVNALGKAMFYNRTGAINSTGYNSLIGGGPKSMKIDGDGELLVGGHTRFKVILNGDVDALLPSTVTKISIGFYPKGISSGSLRTEAVETLMSPIPQISDFTSVVSDDRSEITITVTLSDYVTSVMSPSMELIYNGDTIIVGEGEQNAGGVVAMVTDNSFNFTVDISNNAGVKDGMKYIFTAVGTMTDTDGQNTTKALDVSNISVTVLDIPTLPTTTLLDISGDDFFIYATWGAEQVSDVSYVKMYLNDVSGSDVVVPLPMDEFSNSTLEQALKTSFNDPNNPRYWYKFATGKTLAGLGDNTLNKFEIEPYSYTGLNISAGAETDTKSIAKNTIIEAAGDVLTPANDKFFKFTGRTRNDNISGDGLVDISYSELTHESATNKDTWVQTIQILLDYPNSINVDIVLQKDLLTQTGLPVDTILNPADLSFNYDSTINKWATNPVDISINVTNAAMAQATADTYKYTLAAGTIITISPKEAYPAANIALDPAIDSGNLAYSIHDAPPGFGVNSIDDIMTKKDQGGAGDSYLEFEIDVEQYTNKNKAEGIFIVDTSANNNKYWETPVNDNGLTAEVLSRQRTYYDISSNERTHTADQKILIVDNTFITDNESPADDIFKHTLKIQVYGMTIDYFKENVSTLKIIAFNRVVMPDTLPGDNFETMKSLNEMYDANKVFDSALLQTSTIDFIDTNKDGKFDMSYSKIEGADHLYAGFVSRTWSFHRVNGEGLVAQTASFTKTKAGVIDSGSFTDLSNNTDLIGQWNIVLSGTYERKDVNGANDGETRFFQPITFVKTIITPPIVTLDTLTDTDDNKTNVTVAVKISGFEPPSPNFTVVALPDDNAWNAAARASLVYDQGSVTPQPHINSTTINNDNTYKLSFTIPYKIKRTDDTNLSTYSIVVVVADQNLQGHVGNL